MVPFRPKLLWAPPRKTANLSLLSSLLFYSYVNFTSNQGPAVNLNYAYSRCGPGLPDNYFPNCFSTPCSNSWTQPVPTLTCTPPLPTSTPTKAPTTSPTRSPTAPTVAPTVAPPYPVCGSGSPLSNTFGYVYNVITVPDSTALNAALNSLSQPTIIQLSTNGTYSLTKAYTVNVDLCIQVGGHG